MRVTIRRKYWTVVWKRSITHKGKRCDGLTIRREWGGNELWLDENLRGRDLIETVIHEVFHASAEPIDEPLCEYVCWLASFVVQNSKRGIVGRRTCETVLAKVFGFAGFHMTADFAKGIARDVAKMLHHPEILERITDG